MKFIVTFIVCFFPTLAIAVNISVDELPQNNNTLVQNGRHIINIPAQAVGSSSGISQSVYLGDRFQEASLQYKLSISEHFNCNKRTSRGKDLTGKFPGLSGGKTPNTGGLEAKQINKYGWSVRLTYRGCSFESYVYDNKMIPRYGKKTYGKRSKVPGIKIIPGEEYQVTISVKMNTSSDKADGVITITINGQTLTQDNVLLNNGIGSGPIDTLRYSVFNGGGSKWKLNYPFNINIWDVHYYPK